MTKKQTVLFIILPVGIIMLAMFYYNFKDSCFNGNGTACLEKSNDYANYQMAQESETFTLKACHAGNYEGCIRYADFAMAKGDLTLTREYLFQACKLNRAGCHASINFELIQNNLKDALEMAGIPCNEENDLVSCYYLGLIKIKQQDYKLGSELLKKSCEGKIGSACYFLALHLKDHGDQDAYLYYLNEGCNFGEDKACSRLSN